MHADLCDPRDEKRLSRFRQVLHSLAAEIVSESDSSLGVSVVTMRIEGEELLVFSDAWSIDIEASPKLVEQILTAMNA